MNSFVISIGSNLTEGKVKVSEAIDWLRGIGHNFENSEIYTTPSVSSDGTVYSNAVVRAQFPYTPEEMNALCKDYEAKCGRVHIKGVPVVIDLDVVIFNGVVLRPKDAKSYYFTKGFAQLGS